MYYYTSVKNYCGSNLDYEPPYPITDDTLCLYMQKTIHEPYIYYSCDSYNFYFKNFYLVIQDYSFLDELMSLHGKEFQCCNIETFMTDFANKFRGVTSITQTDAINFCESYNSGINFFYAINLILIAEYIVQWKQS